jgi:outer membrane lipoprotein SlyB
MRVNEGTKDRVIRVVLGLVLGSLAYAHVGGVAGVWILGIVGAVSFITGLTGFCVVYRLVGIRTCAVPVRK